MANNIRGMLLADAYKLLKRAGYSFPDSYDSNCRNEFTAYKHNAKTIYGRYDMAGYVFDVSESW